MSVGVGAYLDPKGLEGLAHFLGQFFSLSIRRVYGFICYLL